MFGSRGIAGDSRSVESDCTGGGGGMGCGDDGGAAGAWPGVCGRRTIWLSQA